MNIGGPEEFRVLQGVSDDEVEGLVLPKVMERGPLNFNVSFFTFNKVKIQRLTKRILRNFRHFFKLQPGEAERWEAEQLPMLRCAIRK